MRGPNNTSGTSRARGLSRRRPRSRSTRPTLNPKAKFLGLLLPLVALACAEPTVQTAGPATPSNPPPAQAGPASSDPFAIDGPVREEWMPILKMPAVDPAKAKLLSPPPGLAPTPGVCDGYASRKGEGKVSCADAAAAL